MRNSRANNTIARCGAIAAILLLAGNACGQFAVQSRGLRYNSGRLANNNGPARDFAAEQRYKNSIVYGGAAGGASFQGNLGYRAPEEFRGNLGSDQLQAFRRDSFYSSLPGHGIRRSEALEYQSSLATGRNSRSNVTGTLDVPRGGQTRPVGSSIGSAFGNGAIARKTVDPDQLFQTSRMGYGSIGRGGGSVEGALAVARSHALSNIKSLQPLRDALGGRTEESDRPSALNPSLVPRANQNYLPSKDLGSLDTSADRNLKNAESMRARTERITTDMRYRAGDTSARAPATPGPSATGAPLPTGTTSTSADALNERLRMLAAPQRATQTDIPSAIRGPSVDELREQFTELRGQLNVTSPAKPGGSDRARTAAGAWQTATSRAISGGVAPRTGVTQAPGATGRTDATLEPGTGPAGETVPERPTSTVNPDTLEIIRRAGTAIDTLLPAGVATRDAFGENMRTGLQLLGQGRYFDADARFSQASSLRRGDFSPMVGRLHSQLGAGMYLSAAQTLRNHLTVHPEATALRFAPGLFPKAERLDRVIEELRRYMAGAGTLQRDSGLLLAYIGFQRSAPDMVKEGLDLFEAAITREAEARSKDAVPGDAAMLSLVRGVWTAPASEPVMQELPTGAPAAPPAEPEKNEPEPPAPAPNGGG